MTSLKGVPLDPYILAGLYAQPLIPREGSPGRRPAADIRYLGENRKNILVLTRDESVAFLADDSLNFLVTVLTACKLTLADIAVVNLYHYPDSSFSGLTACFRPKACLLLGVGASLQEGLPEPGYTIRQMDACKVLAADDLRLISENRSLKAQLWSSLQKLFDLS